MPTQIFTGEIPDFKTDVVIPENKYWRIVYSDTITSQTRGQISKIEMRATVGGADVLSVSAGNLILSDGTNTAQLPITEGEHHIEADFSGSNLILDLDGVTDTVPYDGSLGSGDISAGIDIKRLERV